MADAPKLKDSFTPAVVRSIGERLAAFWPVNPERAPFDVEAFVARTLSPEGEVAFDDLEFTARSRRIADAIEQTADLDPVALMAVLVASLPPELDGSDGSLNEGFSLWPYGDLIGRYGAAYPDEALAACYELTKRFTSEFAIRPILAHHPHRLATVAEWVIDPSEHVRRLVSEGTRPRLPWAKRLHLPVAEIIPILHALRADPSAYVRKSVANHLNDLAKDQPDLILATLAEWHAEATADGIAETVWIVRHALRNHLKNGTPAALAIFGYGPPQVDVADATVAARTATIGESIELTFDLASTSDTDQLLMVDLVMGYVKADGSISPKVFKFRELTLAARDVVSCTKRFDMVVRSTRKLYPGEHTLTVRVNGADLATARFDLTE